MKGVFLAILGFALLASLEASTFKKLNPKNVFVDAFSRLHQGPPLPPRKSNRIVTEGNMVQQIDHFDVDNTETINQRFLTNYEHYQTGSGAPLFIMVGGEFPIFEDWLLGGHMYDMAAEHGSPMFLLEHRFFGRSFPANRTANMDTLQYLTAEQALYDVAYFIEQIRYLLPQFNDAQVILVGASYGGSLVTWYQKTYYYLIDGAWASSAPVNAVEDFSEALEVTGAVLRHHGGQACYNRVENAFIELEALYEAENFDEIRRELHLCDTATFQTQRGRWTLFEILATEFMIAAAIFDQELIDMSCALIQSAPTDLEGLGLITEFFLDGQCLDFNYEEIVDLVQQETWENEWNLEIRLVLYMYCTEFGWFPSSSSPNQPFGHSVPVEFLYAICEDIFGITEAQIHAGVADTNERFGGYNPTVYNLITTQGRKDPWRPVGVQYQVQGNSTVHIIEGAGHSADLFSISGYDTDEVVAAKELIAETISGWLAAGRRNKA